MYTINSSISFSSLPLVIKKYIFEWSDDVVVRRVCKEWKRCFHLFIYDQWIRAEKEENFLEGFRVKLTQIRKNANVENSSDKEKFFLFARQIYFDMVRVKSNFNPQVHYEFQISSLFLNLYKAWKYEPIQKIVQAALAHRGFIPDSCRNFRTIEEMAENIEVYLNDCKHMIFSFDLRSLKLDRLDKSIKYLDNCSHLRLSSNQLIVLPDTIKELPELEKINIKKNCFKIFPNILFRCQNLKEINISYNQLEEIPSEITLLSQLKTLKISGNKLKTFPTSLFYCKYLVEIDIDKNELEEIPAEIAQMSKLAKLNISN